MLQNQRPERLIAAIKSSDVIGMVVQNNQNEKLGKVEDLGVDMESGRIVQVILSSGGFLGMGSTLNAVPPRSLHYDSANKVLHLDITREKLGAAPKFDTTKWEELTQSNRLAEVYGYYGENPYFMAAHDGDWTTNKDGTIGADATSPGQLNARDKQARPERASLGYVQKASKLMGTQVKNPQGDKLGKVENIVLDLSAGRIVAVIISSGGFIGLGDELSAVPPTAFQYNASHDSLELNTSKEMLSASPHFKANEWPDLGQPAYAGGVYRAYKVEPYFGNETSTDVDSAHRNVRDRDDKTLTPLEQGNGATDINTNAQMRDDTSTDVDNADRNVPDRDDKTLTPLEQGNGTTDINTNAQIRNETSTDADNTRRNVRDRGTKTLTPLDQGNSVADIATTAQIRKEIIADKGMSVNAKNIKIISNGGKVTLRGPVNTAEEKRLIGEIADRIAHAGNVDNQLDVKLPEEP